jgi:hypothetical protein
MWIAASVVGALGCGEHAGKPPATMPVANTVLDVGGIRIELPGNVHAPGGAVSTGDFEATVNPGNGLLKFELVNRQIRVNGMSYGAVQPGDYVRVTADGIVYVNDMERRVEGE